MGSALDSIFKIAEGQDGFFTTRQASAEGVSKQAIVQAERRGRVQRYQRGVYRLNAFPFNSNTGHYWEAILWPQSRSEVPATLSHQTALRLHELTDVNPEQVHITVPKAVRVQRPAPSWISVHRADIRENDLDYVDGLPVTSISRTLQDVLDDPTLNAALVQDAIADAERRGITIPETIKKQAGRSHS